MTKSLKVLIIAGARPNFIKIAPLVKAAAGWNDANPSVRLDWKVVHTGQHYDEKMSDIFFAELGIPQPDINLEVGSGSHATQTANILTRFERICETESPDWVIVVGDVNSTMACSLVCAKMGIRVAHVEAGLRSFDRSMPEEINRLVTDSLADLLLTPSADADENLRKEGIPADKIRLVGNIMIDTLVENIQKAEHRPTMRSFGLEERRFVYVTLHRPSNVDEKDSLNNVMTELVRLSHQLPVVFPMHPRTKKMLREFGISVSGANGLNLCDPVGYHDSINLARGARMVLTDSGGLQEETTFFRTPCLTLRPNTERPITIQLGSNRLTSLPTLHGDIHQTMRSPDRIGEVPPLWDGRTARRCLEHIGALARE